ncbi:MAG: DegT/DnrJ/EryC1/StrS family aminotransferase [Candidatus Levybacteria bacterium]|nr:DegT/DnrJ/EryC1/StrS family aminotransferase [Candidatus Levybacteria bacterium]
MKIPLTIPLFNSAEEKAVIEVLRSGWITQGPKVAQFEDMVKSYVGAKYAIVTSSATTALFLSLHLIGIGQGDEVIVPSFSFIATANVVVHTGAKPVFVDINPKTYNIDPQKIEAAITKKTKAVIPVDQVGLPCDINAIKKLAKEYKLFIVEDAACALGSLYKGKRIGSLTDITCFSFHPRKLITTGDGGVITTNNRKLAERAKVLRHQGMSASDVIRHNSKKIIHEKYTEIGFNFRMTDLEATVGIEQIRKLDQILEKRAKLAQRYNKIFARSNLIIPPYVPKGYVHNWQSYIVRLRKNKKITRDRLMQKLLECGISTRRGVMAAHLEYPYKKLIGRVSLPETEAATLETICIPIYPQMTRKEQDYVIEKILSFVGN